jgi:hypothetical protein
MRSMCDGGGGSGKDKDSVFELFGIESVGVIDKFLKVLQGNLGSEGRAPRVLEMAIKAVCPRTNDDVVFVGYIAQRSPNTRSREFSRRFSIISERLRNVMRLKKPDRKK